jgi:hypothetical protein
LTAAAANPVRVRRRHATTTFRVPSARGSRRHDWADGIAIASLAATPRDSVERSYEVIELDNGLLRVGVAPALGMRVVYAQDLCGAAPVELFARLDTPANPVPFAGNIGGVKPSFPFFENGTGLIDERGDLAYAAGHCIAQHSAGAVSVIMSLSFSHHQAASDGGFLGRYGDKVLGVIVTVEPGRADFAMRLICENPNPLPRGDRIWAAASLPQVLQSDRAGRAARPGGGAWLLPTRWATSHQAAELIDLADGAALRDPRLLAGTDSLFALRLDSGFAGAWYPFEQGGLNRLMLFDEPRNRGVKIYDKRDNTGPFELWTGNTAIFEIPRGFVAGFACSQIETRYCIARGIGRVVYADRHIAVGRGDGGPWSITGFGHRVVDVRDGGGRRLVTSAEIGPGQAIQAVGEDGLDVFDAVSGELLGEIRAAAAQRDVRDRLSHLRAAARRSGFDARLGDVLPLDAARGMHFEMEDVPSKWDTLSSMAALRAAWRAGPDDDPAVLASIANTAYRHGDFIGAERLLAFARPRAGADVGAALRLLRALMDYEQGVAADFSDCGPRGGYFRALQAIAAGDVASAIDELTAVVGEIPDCVRPRLLLAHLTNDPAWVAPLRSRVPSSVEMWWVLDQLGEEGAAANLDGLLGARAEPRQRLADFADEVRNGCWRHERRYEYDAGWYAGLDLPRFPPYLRRDGASQRPPRVRLTSPSLVSATAAELTVALSPCDAAIARVLYFVDGRQLACSERPPYTVSWSPRAGTHDVLPVAVDSRGNPGVPHTVRVHVEQSHR